jgi:hypothetical protein
LPTSIAQMEDLLDIGKWSVRNVKH